MASAEVLVTRFDELVRPRSVALDVAIGAKLAEVSNVSFVKVVVVLFFSRCSSSSRRRLSR